MWMRKFKHTFVKGDNSTLKEWCRQNCVGHKQGDLTIVYLLTYHLIVLQQFSLTTTIVILATSVDTILRFFV